MIGTQEIHEVVSSIWTSLLGMQIDPATRADPPAERYYTGRVTIRGGWNGTVVVRCALGLARRVAAAMFEVDPASVSSDDMRDAIGEVTNIAAGNLKALMPDPCTLGLPAVEEVPRAELEALNDLDQQARFESHGESFIVTLIAAH